LSFHRHFNNPPPVFGKIFPPFPSLKQDKLFCVIIPKNRPPNQILTTGAKLRALRPLNLLQHAFQTLLRLTFARALPASA
jgi:hypothetical protein